MNQYKFAALDLNILGVDPNSLKVGNGYPTINPIMSMDETLRIIKKQVDINDPSGSNYTIGDKFKTLSDYQKESNKNTARVAELQEIVNRQSQIIGDLNTAVNNVNNIVDTINVQVGEADLPGLNDSIDNLNAAIIDLNDVVEGIPSYGLATPTYSGLMPMEDKAKLDRITLMGSIDLDVVKTKIEEFTTSIADLVTRVEALEPNDEVPEEE